MTAHDDAPKGRGRGIQQVRGLAESNRGDPMKFYITYYKRVEEIMR